MSELNVREMFEYSNLSLNVEMGVDAIMFENLKNQYEFEDEISIDQSEIVCSDMLIVYSEDINKYVTEPLHLLYIQNK